MDNNLIPTNGIYYKIKRFIKNIFLNLKKAHKKNINLIKDDKFGKNSIHNANLRKKFKTFEDYKHQENMAQKLIYGNLDVDELNEYEIEEMIDYFKKDIENIDKELSKIKQHILIMKKRLKRK